MCRHYEGFDEVVELLEKKSGVKNKEDDKVEEALQGADEMDVVVDQEGEDGNEEQTDDIDKE